MATISDVETALRDMIANLFYPDGRQHIAGLGGTTFGYDVRVYAGWPDPQQLDRDMIEVDGTPTAAHVAIFPAAGERVTTRYADVWRQRALPPAAYGLTLDGQTITVSSLTPTLATPNNLAVLINGAPYNVQIATLMSAQDVASALRAVIAVDFPGVSSSGPVITLPGGASALRADVGVVGSAWRPLRTVEKQVTVTVYHSNPQGRAELAEAIDQALAATPWLTYSDETKGRLLYHGSREDDHLQKPNIYRRMLTYTVEYTLIQVQTATQIVVMTSNLRDADGALIKSVSI